MRKRLVVVAVALAAIGAIVGGAIALATTDSEGTVTGLQADRATKAALEATGGGTANEVERDSEAGSSWEVEVTKPNGVTVDVQLDEKFEVLTVEVDSEDPADDRDEDDEGDQDEEDGDE